MATMNPFDLLGDNDNDDPSQLIESAAQLQKVAPKKTPAQDQGQGRGAQAQQQKQAKLPTKPLPPAQAVREAKNETGRGGSRGGRGGGRDFGRGGGRGRGGSYNRDYPSNENANPGLLTNQGEEGEGGKPYERRSYGGPRGPYRGGRYGGFNNEEGRDGERPRRTYERRSGTGHGSEIKREGAGRGNWGTPSDEVALGTLEGAEENEKTMNVENLLEGEDVEGKKEGKPEQAEGKEPEEKEMTLEEYEKLLEEKRKALLALKTEERKVEVDKEFESMQQLSNKKDDESVFIKLGSDKDKKKEVSEKEKAKKSVSINEFLKPGEGERYYNPGGRGRGRGGRGSRGGGSYTGPNRDTNAPAPSIEDPWQFPTLGGK
ncbi:hypothetical protein Cgig2_033258 [Carnegiea gigantea]|uniref:Hyaluronan/mRNA-binding protein domain-containing protein n=1 Tax=Carnegiea gigantea TaxID=171969 RepID=A0A9Q1KUR1_9CARY|nr:hypothetical protein Cgig2_033258 [Carnegiea gigantea]